MPILYKNIKEQIMGMEINISSINTSYTAQSSTKAATQSSKTNNTQTSQATRISQSSTTSTAEELQKT